MEAMSSSSGESRSGGVHAHVRFFFAFPQAQPHAYYATSTKEQQRPAGLKSDEETDFIKLEGWKTVDVKGDGSCFFHCVALGIGVSVEDQRELVSENLTSDHFELYKELYANSKRTLDAEKKKQKPCLATVKELETQMREYGFINDCKNLEDLEKIALGPQYWADQTAIEIIQTRLNFAFCAT